MQTLIDLIRHGEPVGGQRYRGQLDDPLSEKGWQQMRSAVSGAQPWQQIVASPLSRCAAFARELAEKHQLPLHLEADFMEIGFGEWEGKTAEQLEQTDQQKFYDFYADPLKNTPPGAEPLLVFQQRVLTAWQTLLTQYKGQHLLVVGHAGMMRVILAQALQMPTAAMFRLHIPNAGISRLAIVEDGVRSYPQLLFHASQL